MKKKSLNLYIIAGPNGAGKTTFAREFLPQYAKCKNFINADYIAQGLSPFSPEIAAIKAGRLLLQELRELSKKKVDFAFETTLSGRTYLSFLKNLKREGYSIHIFFLWIPTVSLALERIRNRVALGGHNVPDKDVQRRFGRGINNFLKLYKSLFDSWMLFDNSSSKPSLIAKESGGRLEVQDEDIFRGILKKTRSR